MNSNLFTITIALPSLFLATYLACLCLFFDFRTFSFCTQNWQRMRSTVLPSMHCLLGSSCSSPANSALGSLLEDSELLPSFFQPICFHEISFLVSKSEAWFCHVEKSWLVFQSISSQWELLIESDTTLFLSLRFWCSKFLYFSVPSVMFYCEFGRVGHHFNQEILRDVFHRWSFLSWKGSYQLWVNVSDFDLSFFFSFLFSMNNFGENNLIYFLLSVSFSRNIKYILTIT